LDRCLSVAGAGLLFVVGGFRADDADHAHCGPWRDAIFWNFFAGVPGTMFCLAIAALWSYAAWSLYKLEQRGWWLILIAFCVFMASALMTYARHDMMEMYRLMGYPEAQIEQIQKSGLLIGNRMMWLMAFSVLPFLGYLLFIRKFLRRKS